MQNNLSRFFLQASLQTTRRPSYSLAYRKSIFCHPPPFKHVTCDIAISGNHRISLHAYGLALPEYCCRVHSSDCSSCLTLLSIAKRVLEDGYVVLSEAYKSAFPHVTYHCWSAHAPTLVWSLFYSSAFEAIFLAPLCVHSFLFYLRGERRSATFYLRLPIFEFTAVLYLMPTRKDGYSPDLQPRTGKDLVVSHNQRLTL